MKPSCGKPSRQMDHHQFSSIHDKRLNCLRNQCVSPLHCKRSAAVAIKIVQNDANGQRSAGCKRLLCICFCSQPLSRHVCRKGNRTGEDANALECQRLTHRDSCTAFDKKRSLLYDCGRSELAKVHCFQWSIQTSPRRGEMYLIEHVQASDRVATPRREKRGGAANQKTRFSYKIGPRRYLLRFHQVD